MMPSTNVSLIGDLQQNKGDAWTRFAQRYSEAILARLRAECRRRGWPEQDSDDLAQEALLRLPLVCQHYSPSSGQFRAWLTAVLRNQLLDHIRAETRRARAFGGDADQAAELAADALSVTVTEHVADELIAEVRAKAGEDDWTIALELGLDDGRNRIGSESPDRMSLCSQVAQRHGLSVSRVRGIRKRVVGLFEEAAKEYAALIVC